MMGHREKKTTGDEWDYLTGVYHAFKTVRPGYRHKVKKAFSRRVRREAKADVKRNW